MRKEKKVSENSKIHTATERKDWGIVKSYIAWSENKEGGRSKTILELPVDNKFDDDLVLDILKEAHKLHKQKELNK